MWDFLSIIGSVLLEVAGNERWVKDHLPDFRL